jgi:hypothetical protein
MKGHGQHKLHAGGSSYIEYDNASFIEDNVSQFLLICRRKQRTAEAGWATRREDLAGLGARHGEPAVHVAWLKLPGEDRRPATEAVARKLATDRGKRASRRRYALRGETVARRVRLRVMSCRGLEIKPTSRKDKANFSRMCSSRDIFWIATMND